MEVAGDLLTSDFERTALTDELEWRCGVGPDAGWERITPILLKPAESELLSMRRGEAASFLERLGTADGCAD